jgi:hypothetical protein
MLCSEGIGFVQRLSSQHEGDRIVVDRQTTDLLTFAARNNIPNRTDLYFCVRLRSAEIATNPIEPTIFRYSYSSRLRIPADVSPECCGAFAGTPLERQLRARDIETFILTGISTNAGVESTLRRGTGLGFAFVVAEDACSGRDADEHRFAFENIFPRLARVRSVDEVLKALA